MARLLKQLRPSGGSYGFVTTGRVQEWVDADLALSEEISGQHKKIGQTGLKLIHLTQSILKKIRRL
jgi:hypothetical protein